MIKERYVSFEVAKMLKEKGFNEPCRSYFIDDTGDYRRCAVEITNKHCSSEQLLRPTLYMVMEWLREKGVYIYVEPFITISSEGYNLEGFKPWITTFKTNWFNPLSKIGTATYSKTYEEAVDAAIKYSLENLI